MDAVCLFTPICGIKFGNIDSGIAFRIVRIRRYRNRIAQPPHLFILRTRIDENNIFRFHYRQIGIRYPHSESKIVSSGSFRTNRNIEDTIFDRIGTHLVNDARITPSSHSDRTAHIYVFEYAAEPFGKNIRTVRNILFRLYSVRFIAVSVRIDNRNVFNDCAMLNHIKQASGTCFHTLYSMPFAVE